MPILRNLKCLAAFVVLMSYSCDYDRFSDISFDDIEDSGAVFNGPISFLSDNYFGKGYIVNENLTICGRVIANDVTGNWYRSFIVDDGTGAIEVRAGYRELHSHYPIGRQVKINVHGLAVGSYEGVLQLGRKINDYSTWRVEEFGTPTILDKYVYRDRLVDPVEPAERLLTELSESDLGRLVRVSDLRLVGTGEPVTWAVAAKGGALPETGVRDFFDNYGNRISVTTSGYASFANAYVPEERINLTGILVRSKGNGGAESLMLKLRDLNDVESVY